jgi:ATP-dependent DNA helicase RecG
MSGFKLSTEAKIRLETMVRTNDGFEIAEVDLELRGPGDLQGTQQSGDLDLNIADISKDNQLLVYCRQLAQSLLDKDPDLLLEENQKLNVQLRVLEKRKMDWGRIS